ncbi:MAG: metal ABC transporter substrate-binding protein [Candidatus Hodarchaeales archaeon]
MKKSHYFMFIPILLIILSMPMPLELSEGKYQQESSIKVVVSLSIIGDWVSHIAGEDVEVQSIVSGLENPHTYDPDPSEIAAVAGADLFVELGLEGLEPWVKSLMQSEPSLSAKTLILINTSVHEYMDYDEIIDTYNPHVWMSPIKVRSMCVKIYNVLSSLDPAGNTTYYNNLLAYQTELFETLNKIDDAKSILKGQYVLVNHPSFLYLFDLLGMERIGAIEEKEGSEPSASHIAELTQHVNVIGGENVIIVNQPQMDLENVQGISEATGAQIIELTPLMGVEVEPELEGEFGQFVDSYIEMLNYDIYKLEHVAYNKSSQETSSQTSNSFPLFIVLIAITSLTLRTKKRKRSNKLFL